MTSHEPLPASHNQPEYTVSEISTRIRRVVEDNFGHVRVRGEISECKVQTTSGHCYITLKDENNALSAVCWKGTMSKLRYRPEVGMEVIATGKISTYAKGKSSYQLVIEAMEPAGAGALMALLEARRKQLAAEGLFDAARKRPLPFMPRVIGVVTSQSGAVIRDIIHRITDRFPVHVLVWPVAVQGDGAAEQIAAAIAGFNALPAGGAIAAPDVLIVARGGGSLEDLWAFNEEAVVRAAAGSRIPLISAVGHETDTTLIDFAADKRAPTPTAAAEMAVPVREEWRFTAEDWGMRIDRAMQRHLRQEQERLTALSRGLTQPSQLIAHAGQRLDDWAERLTHALPQRLQHYEQALAQLRLSPQHLLRQLQERKATLGQWQERLQRDITQTLARQTQALEATGRMLAQLGVGSILARGYALVRGADGTLVTSHAAAASAASLRVQFHDGEVEVTPTRKNNTAAAKKNPSGGGQESLF